MFDPGLVNVPDIVPPKTFPLKLAPLIFPTTFKLIKLPTLVILGCAEVFNVPDTKVAVRFVVVKLLAIPITNGVE